nr:hypothetical protein [uncultured Niameybacter sp.]
MKSRFKYITIIFLCIILILHPSLYASNASKTSDQDMGKYITNLTLIKNHMYTLSQTVVFSWDEDSSADDALMRLNTSLNNTAKEISLELTDTAPNTPLYRNLLILLNATNYLKGALYELEVLSGQNNPAEKIRTLERYFNFLVYATNSIRFFDNLQSIS